MMKKQIINSNLVLLQEFSHNLQEAVSGTGLTPYALAKKIGLDNAAIKMAMSGEHDLKFSTAVRIAKGMRLSMDWLIVNVLGDNPPAINSTSEVEIKQKNVDFINKISKMNDQDVELLMAIAGILDERRIRAVTKLLHAVQDEKLSNWGNVCDTLEHKKNDIMAKDDKKLKPKANEPRFNEDINEFDDDIFDDNLEEDFEDDEDLDLEDDFDDDDFDEDY